MIVLLLGSGGREHALAWKLRQSPLLTDLHIAPGNAGTVDLGTNVALDISDFDAIAKYCLQETVDLLLVGPEQPLVDGIWNYFATRDELKHIRVIGPSAVAAQLEGSKDFAKKFMARHAIPTASYRSFTQAELEEAKAYIAQHTIPVVLKADGLAAGKGVLICQSHSEALIAIESMLGGQFGEASSTVVVEEFLDGIEFSVFALTDGQHAHILPTAKDYKRIGDGDTGPNTGGMGSVSPVSFLTDDIWTKVRNSIIDPTIRGLQQEDMPYHGFVFFGLILVGDTPKVIEYNCRMGDPETQSVMLRMESDLLALLGAIGTESFAHQKVQIDQRSVATIVLVSQGYPGSYPKGIPIEIGRADRSDHVIFHAGTRLSEGQLITSGGRVLAVSSYGDSLEQALSRSYAAVDTIEYDGKNYRTDIGQDLL